MRRTSKTVLAVGMIGMMLGGLAATSHAQLPDTCQLDGPNVAPSTETAGDVVSFVVSCSTEQAVEFEAAVEAAGIVLTKVTQATTIAAGGTFSQEVHLPASIDAGALACVTLNGEQSCIDTDDPALPELPDPGLPEIPGVPGLSDVPDAIGGGLPLLGPVLQLVTGALSTVTGLLGGLPVPVPGLPL